METLFCIHLGINTMYLKNILLDKRHVYELHNHPQRKGNAVNTFSDDDVVEFMRESNLKQSYIVGNDKTLFILIKTKPIVFTKSLEQQLRKDFSFKKFRRGSY